MEIYAPSKEMLMHYAVEASCEVANKHRFHNQPINAMLDFDHYGGWTLTLHFDDGEVVSYICKKVRSQKEFNSAIYDTMVEAIMWTMLPLFLYDDIDKSLN